MSVDDAKVARLLLIRSRVAAVESRLPTSFASFRRRKGRIRGIQGKEVGEALVIAWKAKKRF